MKIATKEQHKIQFTAPQVKTVRSEYFVKTLNRATPSPDFLENCCEHHKSSSRKTIPPLQK